MNRTLIHICTCLGLSLILTASARGNDLNDGIPLDEPIEDSLQTNINLPFILMKAKAAAMTKNKKDRTLITDENSIGQGNIIFGPGTKLPPGAIIINNSNNEGAAAIGTKK